MTDDEAERFRVLVLPHLDAAFNLARWLVGSEPDAEDVVQDAYVRAMRGFDGLRGSDARPWILAIVRNASLTWLGRNRPQTLAEPLEEEAHADRSEPSPEDAALVAADARAVQQALAELVPRHREMIVLRELEGLSYREIAAVTGTPIGTVMSSLSRAREALRRRLATSAVEA